MFHNMHQDADLGNNNHNAPPGQIRPQWRAAKTQNASGSVDRAGGDNTALGLRQCGAATKPATWGPLSPNACKFGAAHPSARGLRDPPMHDTYPFHTGPLRRGLPVSPPATAQSPSPGTAHRTRKHPREGNQAGEQARKEASEQHEREPMRRGSLVPGLGPWPALEIDLPERNQCIGA